MDPRDGHQTSYERAMKNTFKTTYETSYRGVDTFHRSPVYTERNYDATNLPRDRQYERDSYPYHNEQQDLPEGYVTQNPAPWRRIYDYDYDQRPMNDSSSPRHQEIQQIPIEKKSCHACREPEAYSPKNSNQLRCMHKFCDNCIKRLRTTKERFGDSTAKYFHCDMCPSSMTAGPTVIRFDPYGRRIVPLPASIDGRDPVEKKYNYVLANPQDVDTKHQDKSFCHNCFKIDECTNKLGCHHRYCDNCFKKLHCTDNPFRYTTCLHYFCQICKEKTPESKIIRFDPYGRRLWKFHDARYYNYM